MKVTIENYTEHCLKTWGGENQKERAELGIIGELGEVAEVLKKFLRGDFDEVERDKRLLKELGDLLYYIAVDFHVNEREIAVALRNCNLDISINKFSVLEFSYDWQTFTCDRDNKHYIIEYIQGYLCLIRNHGFTLEQVMQANIEKLADRAKRNKISGDGDER